MAVSKTADVGSNPSAPAKYEINERDGGEHVVKLTEKQKRFIDYYIETGNASEAARRAGYSKGSVTTANKWIIPKNPQFKPDLYDAIGKRLQELKNSRTAALSEVLEFITAVMRGDVAEEVIVTEGTGEGCSKARIMQKQASARDRLEAAKALEKRFGRFIDLEKEEQQLRIAKLKAEVAERNTDKQSETVAFTFDRKEEHTDES